MQRCMRTSHRGLAEANLLGRTRRHGGRRSTVRDRILPLSDQVSAAGQVGQQRTVPGYSQLGLFAARNNLNHDFFPDVARYLGRLC